MSDYPVTHSCGHHGTVYVVNPRCLSKKDDRSIHLAEKRVCPSCYQAACQDQATERFPEPPEFSGSEAQQEYAKTVLQKLLAGVASDDPLVLRIMAQKTLDPRPLLDGWTGSPHHTMIPGQTWQRMILNGAYGDLKPAKKPEGEV